jgi:ribose transport system permease protein
MIAMVIGGMPIVGGAESKVRSAVIGALLVAIMTNGMVLWGINSRIQEVVKGIIFIIVVASTIMLQKKKR